MPDNIVRDSLQRTSLGIAEPNRHYINAAIKSWFISTRFVMTFFLSYSHRKSRRAFFYPYHDSQDRRWMFIFTKHLKKKRLP